MPLRNLLITLAVLAWLAGRILFWLKIDRPLRALGRSPRYPLYPWRVRAALAACREHLGDTRAPTLVMGCWLASFLLWLTLFVSEMEL